nr:hypothetical protein [Aeromonas salmonicida]
MRANTLLLSGLLASLIASTGAIANDNIVALQLGTPSENEKLSIFTADAKYHHMFWRWGGFWLPVWSGCAWWHAEGRG